MVLITDKEQEANELIMRMILELESDAKKIWLIDGLDEKKRDYRNIPYKAIRVVLLNHIESLDDFKAAIKTIKQKNHGRKNRTFIVMRDEKLLEGVKWPVSTLFLETTDDPQFPFVVRKEDKHLSINNSGKIVMPGLDAVTEGEVNEQQT